MNSTRDKIMKKKQRHANEKMKMTGFLLNNNMSLIVRCIMKNSSKVTGLNLNKGFQKRKAKTRLFS